MDHTKNGGDTVKVLARLHGREQERGWIDLELRQVGVRYIASTRQGKPTAAAALALDVGEMYRFTLEDRHETTSNGAAKMFFTAAEPLEAGADSAAVPTVTDSGLTPAMRLDAMLQCQALAKGEPAEYWRLFKAAIDAANGKDTPQ